MKKYDFANYLNNKTAVIRQGKEDYRDGKEWHVLYYSHGSIVWDLGEQGFEDEFAAIQSAIDYIKG